MTLPRVLVPSVLLLAVVSLAGPTTYSQTSEACAQVLFGIESGTDSLSIYDLETASAEIVGPVGADAPVGIAVRPTDAQVFVWDNAGQGLMAVDRCTGHGVSLGASGIKPWRTVYDLIATPEGRIFGVGDLLVEFDLGTGRANDLGTLHDPDGADLPFIGTSAYGPDGRLYAIADPPQSFAYGLPCGAPVEQCRQFVTDLSLDFTNPIGRGSAVMQWTTTGEFDVQGFNVIRLDSQNDRIQLNAVLIPCEECVTGSSHTYAYIVPKHRGAHTLYVELVRLDGAIERYGPASNK